MFFFFIIYLDQVDQIFKGGGRSEPDPAALLKYEFASALTKVDEDDPDDADDYSDDEYGDALLKCHFALVPSKVVLSNESALKSNENKKMTNIRLEDLEVNHLLLEVHSWRQPGDLISTYEKGDL